MTDTEKTGANIYDSPRDIKDAAGYVRRWVNAIELAEKEEEDWFKVASEALKVYNSDEAALTGTAYNIYHANIETMVPALYNSTPVPDIRRRYTDKDPAAKAGADAIERALSYLVDEYDFDDVIERCVFHYAVAGRGIARVHLHSDEIETDLQDENGDPVMDMGAQRIWCRVVPWATFRRGPGKCWEEVPWVAFKHNLTREQLEELNPDLGKSISLDTMIADKDGKEETEEADVFKRGTVWEIWERDTRRVIFIAPAYEKGPIKIVDDPLSLKDFFPVPRPMQFSRGDDTLVPLCVYQVQKPLLDELDTVSRRIRRLVKQLRPRAIAPSNVDMDAWAKADDGEIVGMADVMGFLDNGGMDKLLSWFPMEPTVGAIQALYEHREQIKNALFEVSGLADIMRGQSNSNETLGAQQIKTQWGSLRIQRQQQEVQRFARDLLRIKAELIAEKFTPENIAAMTGIQLDDAALQVITNDKMRGYRIDIETDSTIRGDLTRNMTAMTQFVQGSAQYFQAFATAAQAGFPPDALVTIYSAFARNFKLGKEVDAILDGLPEQIKQQMAQQAQQPNPEAEKVKMEMEAMQAKNQLEMEKGKADLAMKAQAGQMDMEIKKADLGIKGMEMQMKREEMGMKAEASQIDHAMKMQQGQQSHQFSMQQMVEQAKVKAATKPAKAAK